jgi:hypothetical protein
MSGVPPRVEPRYQRGLFGAFALFNALRVVSYFPTFWAIHASGDSSQHSLWTWFIWSGSNLLTGLWHLERQQRRLDCTAAVLLVNAAMCAAAFVLVAAYRG